MYRLITCMAPVVILLLCMAILGADRTQASGPVNKHECPILKIDIHGKSTNRRACRTIDQTDAEASTLHDYWSVEPRMLVPTTGQISTLLRDGRVLLTGGMLAGVDLPPVPWTQIYSPDTRSWSFGPRMHTGRVGATATLLLDGRVLVVGGLGARRRPVATAEIFDPTKNAWTMAAPLPQTRVAHTASVLPDGRILVVGGVVNGALTRTALQYDPALDQWSPSAPTHFVHALQSSVTLRDNRVMIAGGYGRGVEVYQPRNNSWTVHSSMPFRTVGVLILLDDSTVLMVSGVNAQHHDQVSSAVFNPSTENWKPSASILASRNGATGTILQDGAVLLAGGGHLAGNALASTELYNPMSRTWSRAASMHVARNVHTATPLKDHTVLVCGGINRTGVLDSCELYHP